MSGGIQQHLWERFAARATIARPVHTIFNGRKRSEQCFNAGIDGFNLRDVDEPARNTALIGNNSQRQSSRTERIQQRFCAVYRLHQLRVTIVGHINQQRAVAIEKYGLDGCGYC